MTKRIVACLVAGLALLKPNSFAQSHATGWIEQAPKTVAQTRSLARTAMPLSASAEMRDRMPPVGFCVAWATSHAMASYFLATLAGTPRRVDSM
jgi:hypothetical protein